tara:strand:- start:447 stop:704 length:258 start_codon:yes stop_codon:yes gene_type:complete
MMSDSDSETKKNTPWRHTTETNTKPPYPNYSVGSAGHKERNTALLNRLERDIAQLQGDIKSIKDDVSIIKEYIQLKQKKEDARWF